MWGGGRKKSRNFNCKYWQVLGQERQKSVTFEEPCDLSQHSPEFFPKVFRIRFNYFIASIPVHGKHI